MRLRRLVTAAAAAAAAISVGGLAAVPTAGAAGSNPNVVRLAIANYLGPYSSGACQRMKLSGGTAYNLTSGPYINFDVLGPGDGESCTSIVAALLDAGVQVVSNRDATLLTLTGTTDLSGYGYMGPQTVTLSYQGVGTPSHLLNVEPGPGVAFSSAIQRECTATLTLSNAAGEVEATYSSTGSYSDCSLIAGVASTPTN